MYCKGSLFFLCGDFNARVSNLEDFILGIDKIPERYGIDFKCNKYGEQLCDFLINSNCCILNGRGYKNNGFTFVNTQGTSVVDYCLIPYDRLDKYHNFEVSSFSDMINEKVQVGKDQVKAQSEKDSHSKNRGG